MRHCAIPQRLPWLLLALLVLPQVASANGASDAFTSTTLLLILFLTVADICGVLAEKLGMTEMVGEIFAGIVLGNLALIGIDFDVGELLRSSDFMVYASELAIVLLLFIVGLESNAKELLKVGANAGSVALAGVALPLILGAFASTSVGFAAGIDSWFVGATLAATSVGITAKLLEESGLINTPSARVILGAAVLDDVLGILILAVLAGILASGTFQVSGLLLIAAKAILFFALAVWLAHRILPAAVHFASLSKHSSIWAGLALSFALIMAQLAAYADLAPLIGAFLAGLLLDDMHFVVGGHKAKHRVEEMLQPMTDIMLSIFFVGIGSQVQLGLLADISTLMVIAMLLVVALASKAIAGFAARGAEFDRLGIGLGMVPRGEVGLVFASFALTHQIFDSQMFSLIVLIVLLSTIIGPILLKPRLPYFKSEAHGPEIHDQQSSPKRLRSR